MPNINQQLAHDLTDHGVDLLRLSAGASRELMQYLSQLEADIVERLRRSSLSASAQARLIAVLRDVHKLTQDQYAQMGDLFDANMLKVVTTEAAVVTKIVNASVGVSIVKNLLPKNVLATITAELLVQSAPMQSWFSQQGAKVSFEFARMVRAGMAIGETNEQIVRRIVGTATVPGLLDAPRKAVRTLVQTSVQTGANAARLAVFRANSDVLKGMMQLSTLDNVTSDICIAYDHATWDLDGEPIGDTTLPFINEGGSEDAIPRHWNCRSVIVPITKSWDEMGSKIHVDEMAPGTRASMDGQVAAATDYQSWFKSRTQAQQDDILGKGKAQLWRDGKITMTDLLNQAGRPLTLDQLQAKHGV